MINKQNIIHIICIMNMLNMCKYHMAVCQNLVPLVNIKIAGM